MSDLKRRITRLEEARIDPYNDFFYEVCCQFAADQGKPKPEKQPNIVLTMKMLAEHYLPL